MLRAIREIQPRYVVGENVRGFTNWSGGMVFDQVQADLEAEGYEVTPFLLPACAVNAPHRRDRIWIVAHANSIRRERLQREFGIVESTRQRGKTDEKDSEYPSSDTQSIRQQRPRRAKGQSNPKEDVDWKKYRAFNVSGWPNESPVYRGNDGLSEKLDGITFSQFSRESIKAYGNAIVPQVAYQIFKAIEAL